MNDASRGALHRSLANGEAQVGGHIYRSSAFRSRLWRSTSMRQPLQREVRPSRFFGERWNCSNGLDSPHREQILESRHLGSAAAGSVRFQLIVNILV